MAAKVKSKVKRDPQKTKRLLLEAGIGLFSARGYHGVSVDEIVVQAGCNKRMLYHYFQSKDGLYIEVLRLVFGKLETYELESLKESEGTADAIRELLASYFDFLQQNPEFVSLLMWENLNQGRFLESHPQLLTKAPILERLTLIIKQGTERGEISIDTDPRHLLILLTGVCFIYFSNQHTLSHTLGLDLSRPSILNQGLQLAQEVVLNGLIK